MSETREYVVVTDVMGTNLTMLDAQLVRYIDGLK